MYNLTELEALAREYRVGAVSPAFTDEPYTRSVLHRGAGLEIALVCFAAGQTSSVHHHQGSHCVVRVLRGTLLETLFAGEGQLKFLSNHVLAEGDISGLDGWQVHQLCNLDSQGSVLLNFYSPPIT